MVWHAIRRLRAHPPSTNRIRGAVLAEGGGKEEVEEDISELDLKNDTTNFLP